MNQKREQSLDALKCIATCMILFHHYQQVLHVQFPHAVNWYGGRFYFGTLVELFFLLSGYFAFSGIQKITGDSCFSDFFRKKYLRFLPMLAIAGSVSILLGYIYARLTRTVYNHTLWDAFASLTGIMRWLNTRPMINNPMWYISVLLFCQVLFFGATYLAKRFRVSPFTLYGLLACTGIFMRSVYIHSDIRSYPFFNEYLARGLFCFFLGLILRQILEISKAHENPSFVFGCLLFVLLFAVLFHYKYCYVENGLYYTLCFLVFPAIIILFKCPSLVKRFAGRKFRFLGAISFNAFLWHAPMLMLMKIWNCFHPVNFQSIPLMILFTASLYLIGSLSFFLLERPIRTKLSRFL